MKASMKKTPAFSTSAKVRSASGALSVNGFSQRMPFPA